LDREAIPCGRLRGLHKDASSTLPWIGQRQGSSSLLLPINTREESRTKRENF